MFRVSCFKIQDTRYKIQDTRLQISTRLPGTAETDSVVRPARAPIQEQCERARIRAIVPIAAAKEDGCALACSVFVSTNLAHALSGIPAGI